MKKLTAFFVLCLFAAFAQNASAQNSDLSSIIPSSAPAFTILGTSPTEISKPNNWNALEASLIQNFSSNNNAVIPKNFALEFSPYWLSNHPTFTYKNYLDAPGFSFRNLKISIATSTVPFGKDSVQGMGFGFRIPIRTFSKNATKSAMALDNLIEEQAKETTDYQSPFMFWITSDFKGKGQTVGNFLDAIDNNIKTAPDPFWKTYASQITKIKEDTIMVAFGNKKNDLFTDDQKAIENCVQAYISAHNHSGAADITKQISASLKDAAQLEISGAMSMVFPTGQFNYSQLSKFGLWSDYSFNLSDKGKSDGTIAFRYVRQFQVDTIAAVNNFDLLGRFNLYLDAGQKFNISAWGLLRLKAADAKTIVVNGLTYRNFSGTWDNKYGIDISYKVADNVAFAYSFGKGYGADPFSLPKLQNQLLSFLSMYYSINTKVAKSGDNYLIKSL